MLAGYEKPCKKPDIDNIAKVILDSLNDIAYHDDTQVVSLCMTKKYAETPRVEVEIQTLLEMKTRQVKPLKRDSFVLYTEYMEQVNLLSIEQRGVLLTAIFSYAADAELPEMDGITRGICI